MARSPNSGTAASSSRSDHRSMTGVKVAAALSDVLQRRAPQAITVDNGGEFVSRAMDAWAYAHDVRLDFIRPLA